MLLLMGPLSGSAQLMRPGDASNNGYCSHVDVLYVGLAFGSQGPARQSPTTNWSPPQSFTPWLLSTPDGVNYGHIDSDGNGTIDSMDVGAIYQNIDSTASPVIFGDSVNNIGQPGAPPITLNLPSDSVTVQGVVTYTIDLVLGDSVNPVDSLHGIAFTLTYDPSIVDTVLVNLHGGWMANSLGVIRGFWVDNVNGVIRGVITNTDQMNRAGFGAIGAIGIVMDDNIRLSGNYTLPLNFTYIRTFTAAASAVEIYPENVELTVLTLDRDAAEAPAMELFPNPSTGMVRLQTPGQLTGTVSLRDHRGALVRTFSQGPLNDRRLNLGRQAAGIYFIEVRTESGSMIRKKLLLLP
jgi:hypothetical protein